MPFTRPADCHPDRLRKTADGLCDTCYRRRRYQTDPDHRARILADHRKPPRTSRHGTCPCGIEFTTTSHNRIYCTTACMSKHTKRRARRRGRPADTPVIMVGQSHRTGHVGPVRARWLGRGGMFVHCPSCNALAGLVDEDPAERHCHRCDLAFELHPIAAIPV